MGLEHEHERQEHEAESSLIVHSANEREVQRKEREVERLKQESEAHREEVEKLQRQIAEMKRSNDELKSRIDNIWSSLPSTSEEIKNLLDNMNQKLNEVNEKLNIDITSMFARSGTTMREAVEASLQNVITALQNNINGIQALKDSMEGRLPDELVNHLRHLETIKNFMEQQNRERESLKWYTGKNRWNVLAAGLSAVSLLVTVFGLGAGIYYWVDLTNSLNSKDRNLAAKLKEWANLPEGVFWNTFADFVSKKAPLVYEQVSFLQTVKDLMDQMLPSQAKYQFKPEKPETTVVADIVDSAKKNKSYAAMYQFVADYRYPPQATTTEALSRSVKCSLLIAAHGALIDSGISFAST